MKFEIKNWLTGGIIFECEAESFGIAVKLAIEAKTSLSYADLSYANLRSADLSYANLSYADLRSANLRSADLSYANLSYADLRSANLRYANLRYAKGISKFKTSPLYMLLDQPGKIRAYKLVSNDLKSPIHDTKIEYPIGASLEIPADEDEGNDCSFGLNVATLDWCLKEHREGWRILLVEFEAKDIAAIPLGTDGKFRVHRLTVVEELDLTKFGIGDKQEGEGK